MNEGLPEGWARWKVRTLFDCWGGMTPSTSVDSYWGGSVPWISSKDVKAWRLDGGTECITRKALAETRLRLCRPGTVLVVVRSGILAHTLPVSITTREVVVNQDVKALDSRDDQINEWLAVYLRAHEQDILESNRKDGTTVQSVRVDEVLDREVPFPPLAEQRRIVEKVAELLHEVGRAKARLTKVQAILKRFRQSVLAAACSGELTREWRDEHPETQAGYDGVEPPDDQAPLPQGWCWVPFGRLVESLRMGTTVPPGIEPTRFPVLRSSSVRPGVIDLNDVRFLQADESTNEDNFMREGDLLFTRLSGSLDYVANCAVVHDIGKRRIQYPDRLFRARLRDVAMAEFIELCFGSPSLRKSLEVASKSSAGHQRISMGALTDFWIPLAPPVERVEITRRAHELLRLSDALERRIRGVESRVAKLPQAILSKAFSGELVPTEAELARLEGRGYEPASVLLERIKSKKAAEPTTMKKRSTKRQQRVSA